MGDECEVVDINVSHSQIARFLQQRRATSSGRISHTLFTGGSYFVPDTHDEMTKLHEMLDHAYRDGTMPAIQEVHTVRFPFYLDFDLETPARALGEAAVERMATIMNQKMRLFFPEVGALKLLVCTKQNGGTYVEKTGSYKHGIHFYWPHLIVVVNKALAMRNGILRGLDLEDDWTAELGVHRPDWNRIVDRAVYRAHDAHERSGGLRLVGAPKAKKCVSCPKPEPKFFADGTRNESPDPRPPCAVCHRKNNCFVLDRNVYRLTSVYVDGTRDDAERDRINRCPARLFRLTTVRADESQQETPGFTLYEKDLADNETVASGPRRPRGARDECKIDGRKFRGFKQVEGREVQEVMRTLLVRLSEKYAQSKMRIMFDERGKYVVMLTGDGAKYCLNKCDYHTSNHVYMEVQRKMCAQTYVARMRCWSSKMVVYPPHGTTCRDFYSFPEVVLTGDQVRALRLSPAGLVPAETPVTNDAAKRSAGADDAYLRLVEANAKRRLLSTQTADQ